MTYSSASEFLFALPRFGDAGLAAYKPGFERMDALLASMGNPHARFESIHIAGTNGKGSTASMVAAIGTATGMRVGLHTSPHLFEVAERLRIDGVPAPRDWVADATRMYRADIERIQPSFFEASVALSFLFFAESAVDFAVVEVGLGGRLDATNVLRSAASGITHIGLDHTDVLGATPEAIAIEKAGIAKPGIPLLSSIEGFRVASVVQAHAADIGAPFEDVRSTVICTIEKLEPARLILDLKTPNRTYSSLVVGLGGAHQAWNAALAIRLAESAWPTVREASVRHGLAAVRELSGLRGRAEILRERPRIVADVAHNKDGWDAAVSFAAPKNGGRLFVLLGAMADKNIGALAARLAVAGAVALPVGLPSARALREVAWCAILEHHRVPVVRVPDIHAGIDWFLANAGADDVLLVTGSHFAVAGLAGHPDLPV